MQKRFTSEFKRSKSYLANKLLIKVLDKQYRGKNVTIYVVQNWIYNRTPNELLEKAFEELLMEVEPEALEDAFEPTEMAVA